MQYTYVVVCNAHNKDRDSKTGLYLQKQGGLSSSFGGLTKLTKPTRDHPELILSPLWGPAGQLGIILSSLWGLDHLLAGLLEDGEYMYKNTKIVHFEFC